uniref:Uncharacterized protein n=1 Tax=Rhizophora mucronata TaxID=61149 RepID=A0A2P2PA54_RHIMU
MSCRRFCIEHFHVHMILYFLYNCCQLSSSNWSRLFLKSKFFLDVKDVP